ncbi:MlaD family protein [Accumulibacter sp.]|uniref:MlaD family protein n=1 Tax=Accumulibacter sp. TaxID=2053492 RepID=UPI0025CEC827|nr:MlaD family protein [Accumulibacter sp.]MCP5227107.1 MCE family protein [Accumulibacter sp.]
MENRSHALAAGLFALLLGAAAVLSAWWFGGKHEATREYTVVTTKNVTGLSLQGQVRYRGIRVGKVEAITLDPDDLHNILIRITVSKSVPVTHGTTAKIGYQGVTGIAHILLEDTGDDPQPLPGGDGPESRIVMQASLIDQLSDGGSETLAAAREFLVNANKLLDGENRRHFAGVLVNLEATTANANAAVSQLRQLLAQTPASLRLLNATLARAEQAAGKATPLLIEARELVVRLQTVSDRVDHLLGDASSGGIAALAPRLNQLGSELSANSRQLNRVLRLLEEAPQSLVFGPPKRAPGPGEAGYSAPPAVQGSP